MSAKGQKGKMSRRLQSAKIYLTPEKYFLFSFEAKKQQMTEQHINDGQNNNDLFICC